jgi:hypothetical protein
LKPSRVGRPDAKEEAGAQTADSGNPGNLDAAISLILHVDIIMFFRNLFPMAVAQVLEMNMRKRLSSFPKTSVPKTIQDTSMHPRSTPFEVSVGR